MVWADLLVGYIALLCRHHSTMTVSLAFFMSPSFASPNLTISRPFASAASSTIYHFNHPPAQAPASESVHNYHPHLAHAYRAYFHMAASPSTLPTIISCPGNPMPQYITASHSSFRTRKFCKLAGSYQSIQVSHRNTCSKQAATQVWQVPRPCVFLGTPKNRAPLLATEPTQKPEVYISGFCAGLTPVGKVL